MSFIQLLLIWLCFAFCALGQITAAPSCPIQADPWHSRVGLLVQKREVKTYCDSSSKFYCFSPAACVSGHDGYIGCCTAVGTICAPRSNCIEHTSGVLANCDYITGGCVYCSDPGLPFCTTQHRDGNYVLGCGTERLDTTYTNTGTDTQSDMLAISTASSTSRSAAPSASPTATSQPAPTSSKTDASAAQSSLSSSSALSSSSPEQAANTSASTEPAKSSSLATSRELIIGVVIGAAAGTVIVLALLFVLWRYYKQRRAGAIQTPKDESTPAGYSIGSGEEDTSAHDPSQSDGAVGRTHGPAELEEQSRRSSEDTTGDEQVSSAGPGSSTRYRCLNPDSPDDIQGGPERRPPSWTTSPVPGVAEAPGNIPAWRSPSISTMASPALSTSNSSLWMAGPSTATPRMRSQYVAYTPSVYTNSGQPPSSLPRVRDDEGGEAQSQPVAELEAKEVGRAH